MTKKKGLSRSRLEKYVLFVEKFLVVCLTIIPIAAFFIVFCPWTPAPVDEVRIYYLDYYYNQAPEKTNYLLNQWLEHNIVTEVDVDYFRARFFDEALVLISHDEGASYLVVDYVGRDEGSDILFHNRSIAGDFPWPRLAYEPYDWEVIWESNTLLVYFHPNWFNTALLFILAVLISVVVYSFSSSIIRDSAQPLKTKKKE